MGCMTAYTCEILKSGTAVMVIFVKLERKDHISMQSEQPFLLFTYYCTYVNSRRGLVTYYQILLAFISYTFPLS